MMLTALPFGEGCAICLIYIWVMQMMLIHIFKQGLLDPDNIQLMITQQYQYVQKRYLLKKCLKLC